MDPDFRQDDEEGNATMDFDEQLRRTFGTADLDTLSPEAIQSGIEKMLVEFGLEKDSGRRFALWTLLHMLGAAPDLEIAFKDEEDREAARDFMDMIDAEDED
jgi:hypothetical protein